MTKRQDLLTYIDVSIYLPNPKIWTYLSIWQEAIISNCYKIIQKNWRVNENLEVKTCVW